MPVTKVGNPIVGDVPPKTEHLPFEEIFDAAPALIAVYRGPDHLCIYTNPAHNRAFGNRDLIGRKLRDACPAHEDQGLSERLDHVFELGTTLEIPEFEVTLKVGRTQPTRSFYRQTLQPWRDAGGAIAGVMSFAFDVTEQVEARLRAEASERHLSFALEVGEGVGIFDWDVDRDAMKVDARFLSAFGLNPAQSHNDLPLKDFLNAIHEDDRTRVAAAVQRAIDTGEDYEEEYRVNGKGGADRHLLARGACLRDAQGKPNRFTGIVVDISKQHRDKHALRESETRLRTVLTSLDQGYCVAEMIRDAAGEPVDYRYIEVNPQFEQMTGLKNATGRRMLDLVPNLEDKWAKIYGRVAFDGKTVRFEDQSEAMGRWFDVFATPVLPYGRFAVVFRDVTAEKLTRESLRKSEAEFRTITEAMPQIVWATRPDGHHDFYNARWYEFTGVPEGSTDGEGWSDIFHLDDQRGARQRWLHSLKTGDPYEVEYRLRHHSGQFRWALGRAQAVRNRDGEIVRWLGTCTDIHDLKVAEEQRQLMLAEMNHRVKNTLAMVHAMVSQTLRQADNLKDASASIQSRIGMMAKAHDQLINSTWAETRIIEVVETTLTPHRSGEGRFSLAGPDIAIGSKQALALTMALHELATNAVKYGALSVEGGKVAIIWSVERIDGDDVFSFSWTERHGPPVQPPVRRGFGSRMVENALAGYFDGNAELSYDPSGLSFNLTAPLAGLTA
ncbi:PAS domain-containing protein [Oceaniovalibus sp. ACAM 378]|uniref:PAS domain-containing protein n=1 Tax=Oceaniovalibus sp. ACAM 378 TaxID=2599923 RepID=UPI0011DA5E1D|nr:PAS domain-containing protein [Oceaniovalibus sp. ACAM 378]TYB89419.1 PAS domain-containing protein [Oceaniovalibus sp. ACAM 378]